MIGGAIPATSIRIMRLRLIHFVPHSSPIHVEKKAFKSFKVSFDVVDAHCSPITSWERVHFLFCRLGRLLGLPATKIKKTCSRGENDQSYRRQRTVEGFHRYQVNTKTTLTHVYTIERWHIDQFSSPRVNENDHRCCHTIEANASRPVPSVLGLMIVNTRSCGFVTSNKNWWENPHVLWHNSIHPFRARKYFDKQETYSSLQLVRFRIHGKLPCFCQSTLV